MSLPDNAVDEVKQRKRANSVDRRRVSEETLSAIDDALDQIDDPDATDAIRELAHVVTGDDRFDARS